MTTAELTTEASRVMLYLGQTGVAWSEWQPPEGGRYKLCFTRIWSPYFGNGFDGAPMDGQWVVVSVIDWGAFIVQIFDCDAPITWDYVQSKISRSLPRPDSERLADLISAMRAAAFRHARQERT